MGENTTALESILYQDSLVGKQNREEDNRQLFIVTLEYWSVVCAVSFIAFMMQCIYKHYCKTKSNKDMVPIFSDPSLNEIELPTYRKNSIDEDDSEKELILHESNSDTKKESWNKRGWSCLKTSGQYVIYGGALISFQYLFFNYVVYYYKPLSMEEIKYFIYMKLISD